MRRDAAIRSAPHGGSVGDVRQAAPITLSDQEFHEIRVVIKELTGISMSDTKRHLICRRLAARLQATNVSTFREYMHYLKKRDPKEIDAFSNAVTTNLTSFFRERHHFDFLVKTIIPEIIAKKGASNKRLRIWSAGCSTGEEPYSIAITLKESFQDLALWDAKILCTDLDSDVLKTCRAGAYSEQRVEKIPDRLRRRWFGSEHAQTDAQVRVGPQLQTMTVFKQLNLMNDWPMKGRFDVIFCRNVIIYFDKPTQRVLIDRFADILEDGGYLILGHSESLYNVSDRFSLLGQTVYRKEI
ncbi:MAG: protein-glutamate O-methyltransferase CheR [Gammaproteobacteria bacterium]|nr:protein-glutamate O-methyltransferase CheR [Gammaproteobacteria bacterium]